MRPSDYDDPQLSQAREAQSIEYEAQQKMYNRGRPTRWVTLPARARYIRVEGPVVADNQARYRAGNNRQEPTVSVHETLDHPTALVGDKTPVVTAFAVKFAGFTSITYGYLVGDATKTAVFTDAALEVEIPIEAAVRGYPELNPPGTVEQHKVETSGLTVTNS